jgi:hypothetical protein
MRLTILAAAAAIAFAGSNGTGWASCFDAARSGSSLAAKLVLPPHAAADEAKQVYGPHQIVGFWHTTYTAGGQVFLESLQQWHNDGTEFEFANIPPAVGDICMGAWAKDSQGIVQLYHTAWTFDPTGTLTGTMVFTASYKVNHHGMAFSGPFDLKFLDTSGNLLNQVTGEATSERIPSP